MRRRTQSPTLTLLPSQPPPCAHLRQPQGKQKKSSLPRTAIQNPLKTETLAARGSDLCTALMALLATHVVFLD